MFKKNNLQEKNLQENYKSMYDFRFMNNETAIEENESRKTQELHTYRRMDGKIQEYWTNRYSVFDDKDERLIQIKDICKTLYHHLRTICSYFII